MKNQNWIGLESANLNTKNESLKVDEENAQNNFYGRTYNEEVPYNQTNFAALQSLLDQRNELLGSVRSINHI